MRKQPEKREPQPPELPPDQWEKIDAFCASERARHASDSRHVDGCPGCDAFGVCALSCGGSSMILEIFACAGGMATGFRRAGIEIDLAFDFSPDAGASYTANLGHAPIRMDVRDLLKMVRAGWRPGRRVDLMICDPPCTPWSRAGKREGLDDERDMLSDTCELIRWLRPACWLIGNVPGLDDSNNADVVQSTIGAIADYVVDYKKFDCADYGVPQHRIRPFWFGRTIASDPIRWPAPTHHDPANGASLFGETRPWVTCREALSHLSPEERGRPVRVTKHRDHNLTAAESPAKTVTRNSCGDGVSKNHRDEPSQVVSAGSLGRQSRILEWPWDLPATTVQADDRLAPPGHHPFDWGALMSQPNAVRLSEKALMILQGLPNGFVIIGKTKTARLSQIGQLMPPPLAEAVARSIKTWMERHDILAKAAE